MKKITQLAITLLIISSCSEKQTMEKPSFIGFCYWLLDNPIALAFIILTSANVVIQAILFFKKENK